jgi:hypothetical protein
MEPAILHTLLLVEQHLAFSFWAVGYTIYMHHDFFSPLFLLTGLSPALTLDLLDVAVPRDLLDVDGPRDDG